MILSFKMKGSDHFLMLWFQKDSLDTVGFRTFRTSGGGPQNVLNGQQYVIQMTKRPFWHLASDVLLLPLTLHREISIVVAFLRSLCLSTIADLCHGQAAVRSEWKMRLCYSIFDSIVSCS